jgi:hypothetical protein
MWLMPSSHFQATQSKLSLRLCFPEIIVKWDFLQLEPGVWMSWSSGLPLGALATKAAGYAALMVNDGQRCSTGTLQLQPTICAKTFSAGP